MKRTYTYMVTYAYVESGRSGRACITRLSPIETYEDIKEIDKSLSEDIGDSDVFVTNFILLGDNK